MKNIILFGPPGVGKSTLIGLLKARGDRAIDLEDVYPNKIRFQLPSMLDGVVLGAADLNPKRNYPNAVKVLLYLPEDQYQSRRKNRDKVRPSKALQREHLMKEWLSPNYDAILDVSGDVSSALANYDRIRSQIKGQLLRKGRIKTNGSSNHAPIRFETRDDQE